MSRAWTRSLPLLVLGAALMGCSSMPKLPDVFLNPANRLTAEEGRRLMNQGQQIVDDADGDIDRGKALVKDGRERRRRGEELLSRGRQAMRAAAMAEESERLAIRAEELREEALP